MNESPIFSDDDPLSFPSQRTMRGGDPNTLGRIDHYDLLRKLGGGGFGFVYLARDSVSGIEVAIKTLHPLLKHNAEEMDLLREKFKLVHGLTHPNIAKALVLHLIRDINIWDDSARSELKLASGDSVMVMDYAPGTTLSKWRRQFPDGVVTPELALEIGRQIAAALDYAHGERIVHRDVKPGNIMVETLDDGRIRTRILDFGLAAEIRSSMSRVSTEQGDTSGTRPYMAPEQWLGKKQDGRTDEYALACVLYELLSGAPPFAGVFETGDPMIMKSAVVGDTPDEIEDADSIVNSAILRALSKAPKNRFPSCSAFVSALAGAKASSGPIPKLGGVENGMATRVTPNRSGEPQVGNVCPACSSRNPEGARYCEGCGTPLFRTCPECGKESASRIRFCSGCGTDMDGFAVCKELANKAESATQILDWPAIVEGAKSVPVNVWLPGPIGKKLLESLSQYLQKAKGTLARSQALDDDARKAMEEGLFEQAVASARTSQSLFPGCSANVEFVGLGEQFLELENQLANAASLEDSDGVKTVLDAMRASGMPEKPFRLNQALADEWIHDYEVLSRIREAFSVQD